MPGTKTPDVAAFAPIAVIDRVPPDHVSPHLEHTLELGFLRELVRDAVADCSRPNIDPVISCTSQRHSRFLIEPETLIASAICPAQTTRQVPAPLHAIRKVTGDGNLAAWTPRFPPRPRR